MNANTAKNMDAEPRETMTDIFSKEVFHVIKGGTPDKSTKEFKPVNPFAEQAAENEALTLRLRTLVADALDHSERMSWGGIDEIDKQQFDPSQPLDSKAFGPQIDKPFRETEADADAA